VTLGSRANIACTVVAPLRSSWSPCTTYNGDAPFTCVPAMTTRCGIQLPVTRTSTIRSGVFFGAVWTWRLPEFLPYEASPAAIAVVPTRKLTQAAPTRSFRMTNVVFITLNTEPESLTIQYILRAAAAQPSSKELVAGKSSAHFREYRWAWHAHFAKRLSSSAVAQVCSCAIPVWVAEAERTAR
jgi:hypothetical protein